MEKRKIVLKNGEVYHYVEQGAGEKVILLVHGNFSSSLHFTPLFDRLPKDVRVIAPDLRGFGDSTYYRRISSLYDLAEDLKLFMEAKDIKSADVIGWSLGGGVALEFAAHYPLMVEHLVLINSTTHRGYPIFKKDALGKPMIGQVYESPDEMAKDPVQILPLLNAQKEGNFDFVSYIFGVTIYTVNKPSKEDNKLWIDESLKQRNLADADWALANLNMSDQHNMYNAGSNNISKVKAPVLHTWATKDITVPEYMVLENVNALKKRSKLIVYENCGHSPLVDVPDQLTKDILEFINY
ncbi:intracellular short-chain-length polyhydroxyalkanoate depolymerase [Mariniplasma anaerobium]|uniref:Alpha/beta hydrolase n=1 Tax=Mariniplasma anaerobium TaxID=2735436 RepID=A0A7U9XW47_9MOLU|nr:alpha/beta hydrolase [Mariniplasma anaerobium]BCR36009.1 alpha/beta hydrolase [Mariniplasma anaerobium]